MVLDYYKLREQPFGVTPDSRYLFLGPTHREALASLLYGINAGCGFLALIALPGLGKTTLLFHAMNQLREKARTIFLFQTVSTPLDLLRVLLSGLGVQQAEGTLIEMQSRLKQVLEEQYQLGKRVVVVMDEAQNLDDSVLEVVRMLSNYETSREKLIQIVLAGQPRLAEKIGSPELEQLRQRVSIFAGLEPFSREDTEFYIDHRLRIAGYTSATPLFTRDALTLIAKHSNGIPRNINNLCFSSMSLASALRLKSIDSETVREVISDLDVERFRPQNLPPPRAPQKRPAQKWSHEGPAIPVPSRAPSLLAVWMPKAIPGMLVVLLLLAVVFAARWWPQVAAEHAQTVLSAPIVAAAPAPVKAEPVPQPHAPHPVAVHMRTTVSTLAVVRRAPVNPPPPAGPERVVSGGPGKTLVGICMETFGSCDAEVLQRIRDLNPELSNLDHIEAGQKIRIPASAGQNVTP
jgi:general secretion pathway protein A